MIAVYALSNADCENDIYIGSSKNIKKRMRGHNTSCNKVKARGYNSKLYTFIRNNGGWNKWNYHIIEEFDVYDKKLLKEREDFWMLEFKSTLNSRRVNRTEKEWRKDNKEKVKKAKQKYREDNKAKLSAPNFCECGGVYSYATKARHYKSKKCRKYMASIISPSAPPSL